MEVFPQSERELALIEKMPVDRQFTCSQVQVMAKRAERPQMGEAELTDPSAGFSMLWGRRLAQLEHIRENQVFSPLAGIIGDGDQAHFEGIGVAVIGVIDDREVVTSANFHALGTHRFKIGQFLLDGAGRNFEKERQCRRGDGSQFSGQAGSPEGASQEDSVFCNYFKN